MALIRKLNNDTGATIVMVTHDMDFARYAKRIVYLKDGCIIKDEVFGLILVIWKVKLKIRKVEYTCSIRRNINFMKKIIALAMVILLCILAVPFKAGAAASIPVLVVKSFKADPSPAQPGEVFTLEIVLANEGKKDAENISLTIGETKSAEQNAKDQSEGMTFFAG